MRKIEFTCFGSCTAVSDFAPGDQARVDDRLAVHLVEQAQVARYVDTKVVDAPAASAPRRGRGRSK